MLICNVRIAGLSGLVDVRCVGGIIVQVGSALAGPAQPHIDGAGGALLPGLHDHHLHLHALAARMASVNCGPPRVFDRDGLTVALRGNAGTDWLRGVGYHQSVAGALDRWQLDRIVPDRPVKIQHRSGKLWIVNTAAAHRLSLDNNTALPGVELDSKGRPNGRLWRLDDWIRSQLSGSVSDTFPSLSAVSRSLAAYGVTGVTDTTPDNGPSALASFMRAVQQGELLQRVRVMGGLDLPPWVGESVHYGEVKVMLDEHALPAWDDLATVFQAAHRQGRAVAVHCVTPAELVLALSVLRAVGPAVGDRIEHASLVSDDTLPLLRETGVRVVTQPGFLRERGDQYLQEVAGVEHADLYRCAALLDNTIPLAGSTDAPFGEPDPWAAMQGAVFRESRSGKVIGPNERLSPEQALALFTSPADAPGTAPRRVAVGEVADLCLLDRPWDEARLRLAAGDVRATLRAGEVIYRRDETTARTRQHAIVAA
ncbi:MAG: amidohydrolase family protein [Halioglobus sp.]|nr:amidohydrolase family protein [Halioglobus sp.]